MFCASITDIRRREFPNIYQVLLLCLYPFEFHMGNLWGVLCAIPFFIVSFINGKMGLGDSKAVLLLGGLLGIHQTLASLVAGCASFIIYGIIAGKREGCNTFPFIPFLAGDMQ